MQVIASLRARGLIEVDIKVGEYRMFRAKQQAQ